MPLCECITICGCEVVRGAAALKGPMTYAVFFFGASRMELGPRGWDWGLEEEGGFERSAGPEGTYDLC